jgi:hypothetical protein
MADSFSGGDIVRLDDARAFDATHGFEALAPLHVPFDTITEGGETEARLLRLIKQGRRMVLV